MQSANSPKVLKVTSIISIVLGIDGALIAALVLASGIMLRTGAISTTPELVEAFSSMGVGAHASAAAVIAMGAILLTGALIDLAMGITGIRATKDYSKIGPVWVLSAISLSLITITTFCSIVQGAFAAECLFDIALSGLLFWAANDIKKAGIVTPVAA